jgi:hypothetical protein
MISAAQGTMATHGFFKPVFGWKHLQLRYVAGVGEAEGRLDDRWKVNFEGDGQKYRNPAACAFVNIGPS